jgi:hypothetical protein
MSVDLSREQWPALSREIDAAASLLRHGFAILAEYRFAARDAEPLFACLAGGVEKLLKLTVGVAALDDGDAWPSKATMKKRVGHKIVELDSTVRDMIAGRQERSSAPGLIAQLLTLTDRHAGVVRVLATLERYAVDGRFYNLDLLGGDAQGNPSPHDLWHELEDAVIEANPEMLDQLADRNDREVRTATNEIIAWSLGAWCELVRRSWVTGVFGELARHWSSQLELGHPPLRLEP